MSSYAGSVLLGQLRYRLRAATHSRRTPQPPFFTSGLEKSPAFPGATPPSPHSTPAPSSRPVNSSKPANLHSMAGVMNTVDGMR